MKRCHRRARNGAKLGKSFLVLSITGLLWFIFRTGTKPSRIAYPCQKAALGNSLTLLSASVLFSIATCLTRTEKFLSRRGRSFVLLFLASVAIVNIQQFWGSSNPVQAVEPSRELQLVLQPRMAEAFPASDIYVVNGRLPAPIGELFRLMSLHDLFFYRSNTTGAYQGPSGFIASDDVILIKINSQWSQRGGTNTDLLKELIQAVVDHPDGFAGEIVVADNGQGRGSMIWTQSNAEDPSQSIQDVVDMFSSSHNVSTYDWQNIRQRRAEEYFEGDMVDGYILYDAADPETGIRVSYPKFKTEHETYISFKLGVWNGTGYEKRLKVINMPVLKSHSWFGVTAAMKHYMGVLSEAAFGQGGLSDGHDTVGSGGMGTLMIETGLPTLNIIDAIWVNANPPPSSMCGPSTPYDKATRVNVVMASTDPVALDYWAAKHVLMQTAKMIGYNDTHTIDPDNANETGTIGQALGAWLNLTRNEMVRSGCNCTNDERRMNVYIYEALDTEPPAVSISSPENKTYSARTVALTFSTNESASWIGYNLDGQANITIAGNATLTELPDGSHCVAVYARDASGNTGQSYARFTVDTIPPDIASVTQFPPSDNVLPQDEVRVNATVIDATSTVEQVSLDYTNDNDTWITINMTNSGDFWNATIPAFPYETNITYTITARDRANNVITSGEMGKQYQYRVVPEFQSLHLLPLLAIALVLIAVSGSGLAYPRHRKTGSSRICQMAQVHAFSTDHSPTPPPTADAQTRREPAVVSRWWAGIAGGVVFSLTGAFTFMLATQAMGDYLYFSLIPLGWFGGFGFGVFTKGESRVRGLFGVVFGLSAMLVGLRLIYTTPYEPCLGPNRAASSVMSFAEFLDPIDYLCILGGTIAAFFAGKR